MVTMNSTVLTVMALANTIRSDSVIYSGLDRVPIPSTKEDPLQNRVITAAVTPTILDAVNSHITILPDTLDSLDPHIGRVEKKKSVDSAVNKDSHAIHKSIALRMPTALPSDRTSVAADGQNSHFVVLDAKNKDSVSSSSMEVKDSDSSSSREAKDSVSSSSIEAKNSVSSSISEDNNSGYISNIKDSASNPESEIKDITPSERNSNLSVQETKHILPSQERIKTNAGTEAKVDHPALEDSLAHEDVKKLSQTESNSPALNEGLGTIATQGTGDIKILARGTSSPVVEIKPQLSKIIKNPEEGTSLSTQTEAPSSGKDNKPLISSLTQVTDKYDPKNIESEKTKIVSNTRPPEVHSSTELTQKQGHIPNTNTNEDQNISFSSTENPSIKDKNIPSTNNKNKTSVAAVPMSDKDHKLTNKGNDNDIPKSSIFSPAIIFIIAATSLVLLEALLMYVVSWWKEERESPISGRRFLNFFLRNPSSKTVDNAGSMGPLDDKMVLIPEV